MINYTYDSQGRIATVDRNGMISTYTYDVSGNIDYIITNGNTRDFDVINGKLAIANGYDITYNEGGKIDTATKNGVVSAYTYDVNGNIDYITTSGNLRDFNVANGKITIADGYDVTYNLDGKIATTVKDGITSTYTYDTNGVIKKITTGDVVRNFTFTDGKLSGESTASIQDIIWNSIDIGFPPNEWRHAYGNGVYVAVNSYYAIARSTDNGVTWSFDYTYRSDGSYGTNYICYGGNQFVICGGAANTGRVLTSPDGITWTIRNVPAGLGTFSGICYGTPSGSGLYVITTTGGPNYPVITSLDGITWTTRASSPSRVAWYTICWGNNKFIIAGLSGVIAYSSNGINWYNANNPNASAIYRGVTYGDKFVAVGEGSAGSLERIATSDDGITWTKQLAAQANNLKGVVWDGAKYAAISVSGTNKIQTSTDGITWSVGTAFNTFSPSDISWNSDQFLISGYPGYSGTNLGAIVSSNDGSNWNTLATTKMLLSGYLSVCSGLPSGSTRYVTAGRGGLMVYSNDGQNWVSSFCVSIDWNGVCWGNNKFVAVAETGSPRSMYSTDGITWVHNGLSGSNPWKSVCYGNGYFMAIENFGRTARSSDGISWTISASTSTMDWKNICSGNGKYVAVASSGTNRVMNITTEHTKTYYAVGLNEWRGICYGNGKFIAVASSGTNRVMYSTDGITWSTTDACDSLALYSICHDGTNFWAIGDGSSIAKSGDGITWEISNTNKDSNYKCITSGMVSGQPVVVAVGYKSTTPHVIINNKS